MGNHEYLSFTNQILSKYQEIQHKLDALTEDCACGQTGETDCTLPLYSSRASLQCDRNVDSTTDHVAQHFTLLRHEP